MLAKAIAKRCPPGGLHPTTGRWVGLLRPEAWRRATVHRLLACYEPGSSVPGSRQGAHDGWVLSTSAQALPAAPTAGGLVAPCAW